MTEKKDPTKAELLKKTSNYLKISFSYNYVIVLPYKEGMLLMQSLELAENYNADNYEHPKIESIDVNNTSNILTSEIISQEMYIKYKINALLITN